VRALPRRQGSFDDPMEIESKLPWQVGVALALASSRSGALLELAQANPKVAITSMSWRDFERLVGEAFRRQGFTVTGFGGSGPDGGVDLGLARNGQRFLVQCKHWRKRQVGVTVVLGRGAVLLTGRRTPCA